MKNLEALITDYLKNCRTIKKLDSKTLKAYCIDLAQFQVFMDTQPDFLNKQAINEYLSSLHQTYKPRTAKRKIAAIKAFFHFLVYEEIIAINPFDKINVKFREPQTLPRTIPETVIENFLTTMYHQRALSTTEYQSRVILRDIAVIELLFATGIRISELCSLTPSQVDLTSCKIIIYGKGAKERLIQIGNDNVKKLLMEYYIAYQKDIAAAGWFFVNRFHQRYSEQSVRAMIDKYANLAKIDIHITPHMFRHPYVKPTTKNKFSAKAEIPNYQWR